MPGPKDNTCTIKLIERVISHIITKFWDNCLNYVRANLIIVVQQRWSNGWALLCNNDPDYPTKTYSFTKFDIILRKESRLTAKFRNKQEERVSMLSQNHLHQSWRRYSDPVKWWRANVTKYHPVLSSWTDLWTGLRWIPWEGWAFRRSRPVLASCRDTES